MRGKTTPPTPKFPPRVLSSSSLAHTSYTTDCAHTFERNICLGGRKRLEHICTRRPKLAGAEFQSHLVRLNFGGEGCAWY